MRRRKHKKHTNKRPKAEEKQPKGDKHHNKHGMRKAIAHAFSSGWVQNAGMLFAASVIALIVAMAFSSQVKPAAISFALAGTIFLWIFAAVVIKYAAQGKGNLVVTVKGNLLDTSRSEEHSPIFWIRYRGEYGDTLSPLGVALYLVVHNDQSVPVKIDEMKASIQAKGKDWMPLTHVDTHAGQVYMIFDIKHARPVEDASTELDFILRNPIPPHTPATGWMYLVPPKPYPLPDGTKYRFRFSIKDTSGEMIEQITPFRIASSRAIPDPTSGFGDKFPIKALEGHFDLSGCFRKLWDETVFSRPNK